MRIGVPKEVKNHEYRVGLSPACIAVLVQQGHYAQIQLAGVLAVLVLLAGYGMQFGLAVAFGPGLLLTCGLLVWALVL